MVDHHSPEPPESDDDSRLPRIPDTLPVFPVRDQVIFPRMVFPLLVGREERFVP